MGFLDGGLNRDPNSSVFDDGGIIDPVDNWDEAKQRAKNVDQGAKTGTHPLTVGIGGPAKAGASLVANSGKLLSTGKKVATGSKSLKSALPGVGRIASAPGAANKAKAVAQTTAKAGNKIDIPARLASTGTSGKTPVQYARESVNGAEDALNTIKSWEAPDIDIPTPNDEPQQPKGPSKKLIAAAAALVLGIIVLTQQEVMA